MSLKVYIHHHAQSSGHMFIFMKFSTAMIILLFFSFIVIASYSKQACVSSNSFVNSLNCKTSRINKANSTLSAIIIWKSHNNYEQSLILFIYLFFISEGDGNTHFETSPEQFNQAARRLLKLDIK